MNRNAIAPDDQPDHGSDRASQAGPEPSGGLLARILEAKQTEVTALRPRLPDLRDRALCTPAPPSFDAALRAGDRLALIAEFKRQSPSAGPIAQVDPRDVARSYEAAGASAISVLTDAEFFGGSLADLEAVAQATSLPVLRKDFIIDEAQIYEARAAGASAVLLIARLLDADALRALHDLAVALQLSALVEVHSETELERALSAGATLIGVNNRDLDTLEVDLAVSERLLPLVPPSVVAVAESGIRATADAQRMSAAGADAVLVGEALMKESATGTVAASITRVARDRRRRGSDSSAGPTSHTR